MATRIRWFTADGDYLQTAIVTSLPAGHRALIGAVFSAREPVPGTIVHARNRWWRVCRIAGYTQLLPMQPTSPAVVGLYSKAVQAERAEAARHALCCSE